MRVAGSPPARLTGAVNLIWGAGLLVTGDLLWRDLTGRAPSPPERRVITVLGSRHALQGVLQLLVPGRAAGLWALVDLSHAVSMVAVAAVDPGRRRPAVASAGVSLGSAAGSVAAMRHARRRAAARRVLRATTRARRATRHEVAHPQAPAGGAGSGGGISEPHVVANRPNPPDIR